MALTDSLIMRHGQNVCLDAVITGALGEFIAALLAVCLGEALIKLRHCVHLDEDVGCWRRMRCLRGDVVIELW